MRGYIPNNNCPCKLRKLSKTGVFAGWLIVVLLSNPAYADNSVYPAKWFNHFAPSTAEDMLTYIPGFKILTSSEVRGIGQSSENILINGEQIIAKGNSALEILGRIPAHKVFKVEVKDASAYKITGVAGLVANVVLNRDTPRTLTWQWSPEIRRYVTGRTANFSLATTGSVNSLNYSFGLSNNSASEGEKTGRDISDSSNTLIESRSELFTRKAERPRVSFDISKQVSDSLKFEMNSQGEITRIDDAYNAASLIDDGANTSNYQENSYDIDLTLRVINSNDIERLNFVAIQQYSDGYSQDSSSSFGDLTENALFRRDSSNGESILQTKYVRDNPSGFWQLSAELVYNFLDSKSQFGQSTNSDEPTLFVLADGTAKVDELRSEVFFTRQIILDSSIWELGLGAERSKLSVSGLDQSEGTESRTFFRPKGYVSLHLPINETSDTNFRVERRVDQLDFFNFLGATNFRLNQSSGGNRELIPSQLWEFTGSLEQKFGYQNRFSVQFSYKRHEDLVGSSIVDNQDAIGNIGNGYSADLSSSMSLYASGVLDGWSVNLEGSVHESELTDPITDQKKSFSDSQEWSYFAEIRYEPKGNPLSFRVGMENNRNYDGFTSREVFSFKRVSPFVYALAQHENIFGQTLVIYAGDLLSRKTVRERAIYDDFRDTGPADVHERANEFSGPFVNFTISGSI